jgi:putative FmdB family regulatory protein
MPTYEYTCKNCETSQHISRGINDPEQIVICEKCEHDMKRVYSVGAVTFNGSGFYSKDK